MKANQPIVSLMDMDMQSRPFGGLIPETDIRTLELTCAEVSSGFDALYRSARDFEAFNGNFFTLILQDARHRADKHSLQEFIGDIWTGFLRIAEDIETQRQEHMDKKAICTLCIQQRWCPCDTQYPDFRTYLASLQKLFTDAEIELVARANNTDSESAKVIVGLKPHCVVAIEFRD